ncbi:hypothetical protein Snoj_26360 [Streptomyces nojiriensis]|uniref:NACHT domain-containing protein n=1 Tax=Streptomyces nojiriensis TaxID=66374 RepID=A0ABQ3SKQ4_9ACTN|nr:hypothetical protein [Streptomyces nojiriensis]GGS29809.1 hypothetical protein GCM10010205_69960 [Streptomyces nojiriensis]GHI68718.1 hypothetical protein Snoj_26360 [Streptomyces nojiriensis]
MGPKLGATVSHSGHAVSEDGGTSVTGYCGPAPAAGDGPQNPVQVVHSGASIAINGGTSVSGYVHSLTVQQQLQQQSVQQVAAASLARSVLGTEEDAYNQLVGRDIHAVIDLTFTAEILGQVSALAAEDAAGAVPGHTMKEVTAFYRGLRPGRLVITGPAPSAAGASEDAGTGKTVIALKLIIGLAHARANGEDVKVPVRLSASSWPGGTIREWLTEQLDRVWNLSRSDIRLLLDSYSVLPVIDGVDEMDQDSAHGVVTRAAALMAEVNRYQENAEAGAVVLTCRRPQYDALSADAPVRTVALLTLDRVGSTQAHAYLKARVAQTKRGMDPWSLVLSVLASEPGYEGVARPGDLQPGTLHRALDTPWRLALAATVYHPDTGRDPDALLAHAKDGTLDHHLLDHYIHAALKVHDRAGGPSFAGAARTSRYLGTLADHLRTNADTPGPSVTGRVPSSTDIVLHDLWLLAGRDRVRRTERALLWSVVTLLVVPAAVVAFSLQQHMPVLQASMLAFAPPASLALMIALNSASDFWEEWPQPRRILFARLSAAHIRFLLLPGWVLFGAGSGFCCAWMLHDGVRDRVELALAWGVVAGLLAVLKFAVRTEEEHTLALLLGMPTDRDEPVADPRQPLRDDLAVVLLRLFAIMFAVATTLWIVPGVDPAACLAAAAVCGIWLTLSPKPWDFSTPLPTARGSYDPRPWLAGRAWLRYCAFLLCVRGRLPWRLGKFLEHCWRCGLLRRAGPGWQFRHRELQEHLTSSPSKR